MTIPNSGPVLVFLDSHCEANVGWMEPILDIIADDRTTFVTPVIDAIDAHTMNYPQWSPRIPAVGTFDWYFHDVVSFSKLYMVAFPIPCLTIFNTNVAN